MVRALLSGTKTQTRRVVKGWPLEWLSPPISFTPEYVAHPDNKACPYGQAGDRLWVREAWGFNPDFPGMPGHACYRADRGHEYDGIKWRPSIHMPRAASRITLEVVGVRVERLQDISEADALSEGIEYSELFRGYCIGQAEHFNSHDPRQSYFSLWEAINGAGSVEANPWVWVVEFRRVEQGHG